MQGGLFVWAKAAAVVCGGLLGREWCLCTSGRLTSSHSVRCRMRAHGGGRGWWLGGRPHRFHALHRADVCRSVSKCSTGGCVRSGHCVRVRQAGCVGERSWRMLHAWAACNAWVFDLKSVVVQ